MDSQGLLINSCLFTKTPCVPTTIPALYQISKGMDFYIFNFLYCSSNLFIIVFHYLNTSSLKCHDGTLNKVPNFIIHDFLGHFVPIESYLYLRISLSLSTKKAVMFIEVAMKFASEFSSNDISNFDSLNPRILHIYRIYLAFINVF